MEGVIVTPRGKIFSKKYLGRTRSKGETLSTYRQPKTCYNKVDCCTSNVFTQGFYKPFNSAVSRQLEVGEVGIAEWYRYPEILKQWNIVTCRVIYAESHLKRKAEKLLQLIYRKSAQTKLLLKLSAYSGYD